MGFFQRQKGQRIQTAVIRTGLYHYLYVLHHRRRGGASQKRVLIAKLARVAIILPRTPGVFHRADF